MKIKKIISISGLLLVLVLSTVTEGFGFNDYDAGSYLWKLINQARDNPAKIVKAYDIDIEKAREALGGKAWILDLKNGLPPLVWNGNLAESSHTHNQEMLDQNFYGYTSLDGRTVYDRITAAGYEAEKTGEGIGVLFFNLYMEPMAAAETIFENMLRDELNPEMESPKNIFSTEFTETAVSFISAVFTWDESAPANGYQVTIDYARPVELRSYVIGNIFAVEPPPESQSETDQAVADETGEAPSPEMDSAEDISSSQSWTLERAVYSDISLYLNNMTSEDGDPLFINQGSIGAFQVETTPGCYFLLRAFRTTERDGEMVELPVKQIAAMGLNVNQMIDVPIEVPEDSQE